MEYRSRVSSAQSQPYIVDRIVLLCMSMICGMVALLVLGTTVGAWVKFWPSFGMTLVAVPAILVASAFGYVAYATAKVAIGP